MYKQIFLIILTIILFIVSLDSFQGMIFPMFLITYLLKDKIMLFLNKYTLKTTFIVSGTFFGMLTELFAVINNLSIPIGERVLLSQNPITDMLIAPSYYLSFMILMYFLLIKYNFTNKHIFFIAGLYGVFAENGGAILLNVISNPIFGVATSFLVMCVYAIFPLLAYILTEHKFKLLLRKKPTFKIYLFLPIIFFFYWAILGNIIFPLFRLIFGN